MRGRDWTQGGGGVSDRNALPTAIPVAAPEDPNLSGWTEQELETIRRRAGFVGVPRRQHVLGEDVQRDVDFVAAEDFVMAGTEEDVRRREGVELDAQRSAERDAELENIMSDDVLGTLFFKLSTGIKVHVVATYYYELGIAFAYCNRTWDTRSDAELGWYSLGEEALDGDPPPDEMICKNCCAAMRVADVTPEAAELVVAYIAGMAFESVVSGSVHWDGVGGCGVRFNAQIDDVLGYVRTVTCVECAAGLRDRMMEDRVAEQTFERLDVKVGDHTATDVTRYIVVLEVQHTAGSARPVDERLRLIQEWLKKSSEDVWDAEVYENVGKMLSAYGRSTGIFRESGLWEDTRPPEVPRDTLKYFRANGGREIHIVRGEGRGAWCAFVYQMGMDSAVDSLEAATVDEICARCLALMGAGLRTAAETGGALAVQVPLPLPVSEVVSGVRGGAADPPIVAFVAQHGPVHGADHSDPRPGPWAYCGVRFGNQIHVSVDVSMVNCAECVERYSMLVNKEAMAELRRQQRDAEMEGMSEAYLEAITNPNTSWALPDYDCT